MFLREVPQRSSAPARRALLLVVIGVLLGVAPSLATFTGLTSRIDRVTIAATTKVGNFAGTTIFPAAIGGVVTDWAPTGLSTATTIVEAISSSTNLTGLTGGASGRRIDICNSGLFPMTIVHDSITSAAANRFYLSGATDWQLGTSLGMSCASFVYDATASRWRMISISTTTFPTLTTTGTVTVGTTLGVTGPTTTAGLTNSGATIFSGQISPAAISGTNNDYAPTGFATATDILQDLSAAATLNGLAGGTAGRFITIHNTQTNAARTLSFGNEAAGSTAANRFTLVTGNNYVLAAGGSATFIYDGVASRWRMVQNAGNVGTFSTMTASSTINITGLATLTGGLTTPANIVTTGTAHIKASGSSVSLAAGAGCGTGPVCNSATCNDIAGTFTTGSATTTCTITFAATYTGADDATCSLWALGVNTVPTFTTTATTIVASVILPSQKYGYHCIGH